MDDLKTVYRSALPARIAALEAARDSLGRDGGAAIRSIAHSLRGSGATYGFPQVTAAAAAVEDAGESDLPLRAADLITVLREVAGAAASEAPAARVLLVDDDPEIRLIVTHLLGSAGYSVTVAPDGASAGSAASEARPDIVLMDVQLGADDGIETAAALFRSLAGRPPRLIFLTGAVRAEEFERMEAAAPSGIIHKPFDPESFLSLFERMLSVAR
ncbi:MAG TPA: response regulator [Longimicrobiales bacterium]